MKFREIQLDGFGRLVNRTFTFAPGFNLIFGPNEAGKSTLQHAMLALLYGFFDASWVTSDKRALMAALKPWENNAAYAGILSYALDNGEQFQVSRTFGERPTTKLMTQPDGTDISEQFERSSYSRLFFADVQLGMSKEVFENTCTVRQAELIALEASAGAITDALAKLAASASADTTSTDAIAALETVLKNVIGTPRARTKPLYKAQQHLSSLENEREQVAQTRSELFGKVVELNQLGEQVQALEENRQRLHVLHLRAEIADIERQLASVDAAESKVKQLADEVAHWEAWSTFPAALQEKVNHLKSQRIHLQTACQKAQPLAKQAQTSFGPIRAQLSKVEMRIAELDGVRDTPNQALPRVEELARRWQNAHNTVQNAQARWEKASDALKQVEQPLIQEQAQLAPVIQLSHAGLAQLQLQIRDARQKVHAAQQSFETAKEVWESTGMPKAQFQALEDKVLAIRSGAMPSPKPRRGCNPFPSKKAKQAEQILSELAIYDDIKPIYDRVIETHQVFQDAQQSWADVEKQARVQLGSCTSDDLNTETLTALEQRLERYLHAEAGVEPQRVNVTNLKSEWDAEQQRSDEAQQHLRTELEKLGFATGDLQADLKRYIEQCKQKARLEQAEKEQQHLSLQAQTLEKDIQAWNEQRTALQNTERELCAVLEQADIGCTTNDLDAALDTFAQNLQNHQRWVHAQTAYNTAARQPTLIDEQTCTRLESTLAQLQRDVEKVLTQHPEWRELIPQHTPQAYANQRQHVSQELANAQQTQTRLQETIHRIGDTIKHPAELEEEVSAARVELERLNKFSDALELAKSELEQATQEFQKQFAPKLEATMGQGLRHITDGRYTQVQVNANTLDVSLVAPELDSTISVERLSTGTRDLVYLMLRIAIAQLMSRTGERLPLLLDDPLVQYDRERQERALDFLVKLATETQVFFFTKDEGTRVWFEHMCSGSEKHRVHIL
ncbi:MAG: AAA family ATPase [Anaerolineae bacterium]|nr:AAA family ATPase [Anaerolineae bacterium]